MNEEKITCHTPTPGKQPTAIPAWKYQSIREAILKVIPQQQPGMTFKTLPALVAEQLSDDFKETLGSVSWHTTTVKLKMEVEDELSRVPNVKLQPLVRA